MSQKIFILENEPWLGEHYERTLESQGFETNRAPDPYVAIEMIDDDPPSVIIMSLLLNGAGGVGLLHELQSYVDTARIPVIVCSSLSGLTLEDLEPYGVKKLLNSATMRPTDLTAAVRSVLA